jgi:hypothetical protein
LVESSGYYDVKYSFNLDECIKDIKIEMEPEEKKEIKEEQIETPKETGLVTELEKLKQEEIEPKKERGVAGFLITSIIVITGFIAFFFISKRKKKKHKKK